MATVQLNISLSPAARNAIKDRAEERGVSISQFVTQCALQHEFSRDHHQFTPDTTSREELENLIDRIEALEQFRTEALRRAG
jgi:uncharacterized protein (DUF1778 family)